MKTIMWHAASMGGEKLQTQQNKEEKFIQIKNLKKYFKIPRKGMLHAVDDVSFELYKGETLGLVGESGCGKSTVGNLIMRLLSRTEGEFLYYGDDVFSAGKEQSMEYRKKMQMIFQDPFSSLNPRKTVREILSEAFQIHHLEKGVQLEETLKQLCASVGVSKEMLNYYPHELDGGSRQVVGIARALSLNPEFVVCDEPLSSLDVSVQARIINLLVDIQKQRGLTYLFISHDLSVVRHISDRIAVMYLGQIVEIAETDMLFGNARHPYSLALLSAVPRVDIDKKVTRILLKGDVPSPMNPKPGCRFAPRCWMACEKCFQEDPVLREYENGHQVRCHFAEISAEKAKTARTTSISDR